MTQESRLAIVIDSRQAKPTADELARALAAVDAAGVRVTSSAQGVGRATADASRGMHNMEMSANAAANAIRRNLIAAIGGLSAMKLIDMADDWGQMASRIKMATQSADEYERVQARMIRSANATFRNINETREAFVQLSPVLRQMGMSLEQSMDAIDAFSGLMVTNAASTERGAAAMRALSVSLQKGKMDADQWITIYSTLDSIVDTLAAHSGMAAEEIRKLGAEGKLSVRMIAEALAGQLEPIMAQVEEMPTTVRDAFQKVGNEFTEYIGKANEASGVTAALADGITYFGENLGTVLNAGLVAGSGALAVFTSRMIGSTAATVADTLAKRAAAAQELDLARAQATQTAATLAQLRAQQGLTATRAQLTAATSAQAAAEQRLAAAQAAAGGAGRSLLGILGGPVGLLATVGLTAAAFIAMDGASDRAKLSMDKLTGSADDAAKAFGKLGALSRQAALDSLGELHAEQAREASRAWHEFVSALEPTTARGAKAVAQMRSEMQAEVAAIASNTALSSAEIEQAIDRLIAKWVEEKRITEDQAQAYRSLAAGASALQSTANETGERIAELSQRNKELEAALRGAAGGAAALNEQLITTNEAGKTYLERLTSQAITAGLKTRREELEALVKAGELVYTPEDLEKARKAADHIDRMSASLRAGTQATKDHAQAMKSLLETHLPQVKALDDLHKSLALLDKAQKAGIVTGQNYVKALESINLAYAKQVNDLLPEAIKKAQEQVKAARDQQRQLQQQIRTFGMAESAVLALAAADTDSAIAKLEAAKANEIANGATTERIKHIEAEIQVLRELRDLQLGSAGLQGQLEWREQQRQQWESWARDVEQIFQQVGQSLTDAIFEGGKSGRDLLKDLFKTLTFRVLIQPVMGQMQGWVTNQLGGLFGLQQPAGGGMFGLAQNASSLHSAFTGGFTDTLASGVNWLGEKLGSSALQSFAAGMSGAFTATSPVYALTAAGLTGAGATALPASLAIGPGLQASLGTTIGTAGAGAGAATAGGAASAGSMFAAAAPWVLGGLAVASAFGLFDDRLPTTRRSQQGASHMLPDGSWEVSSWDDRQDTASQIAARDFAQAAVKHANDLFERIGIDAQIHSFQTLMESSILGDKQGVGSSGQVRIGDVIRDIGLTVESSWTRHGFGGWSDQPMLPRLQTDIQLTILEAFQAVGDELPTVLSDMLADVDIRSLGAEQAQALAQRFQLVVDQVSAFQSALEQLPFASLRDLTFDVSAAMISALGGIEGADTALSSYFDNFYSQEEKLDWLSKQVSGSLESVGLTMPDVTQGADAAKQAFRELFESIDPLAPGGAEAAAAMLAVNGRFAELVTGMDQLSDATQRAHQELLNSLMGDVNAALSAVQQRGQERIAKLSESFARTDAVFDAYRSQVQALESQWGSLISTMDRSMRDLRGQVEASARLQYDQARAVISTALLTGQMPQTADLSEAIRVAQQGVTGGRYASAFDQREAYLKLANELEALQGIAKPELDAAQASLEQLEKQYNKLRGIEDYSGKSLSQLEKQLGVALSAEAAARTQIAQIERQIAMAQAQYHELVGINDELSTLPGALQALAKAFNAAAAAQKAQQQSGAQRSRELQYLADNPDVMAQYGQHGRGMSLEEYARLHYDLHGRKEGRSFDVGTPYVPYDMMANIHRGEIIIDPRSSDILRRYGIGVQGGGSRETEQLLREQLAEVRQQNRYLYEIVKSGKRTERNTEDLSMAVAHNPSDDVFVVF